MNRPRRTAGSELAGHPVLFDDSLTDGLDSTVIESRVDKGSTYFDELVKSGLSRKRIAEINTALTDGNPPIPSSDTELGVYTDLGLRARAVDQLMTVLGEINEKSGAVEVSEDPAHHRHGYIKNRIDQMEPKLPLLKKDRDIIMDKLVATHALRATGFSESEIQTTRDHLELRRLAASQKYGKGSRIRARQKTLVNATAERARGTQSASL